MRWIKHYANASDDEELAALIGEFGGDGYMFYWRILEVISGQMKPEDAQTFLEYPWKKWAEKCGLSLQKFKKILNFVETFSLFFLEKSEKTLKIDCPKLLVIKDNHFGNLQVTNKKLDPKNKNKSKSKSIEEDKETDSNLIICTTQKLFDFCGLDFGLQLTNEFLTRNHNQVVNGINQLIANGEKPTGWGLIAKKISTAPNNDHKTFVPAKEDWTSGRYGGSTGSGKRNGEESPKERLARETAGKFEGLG